MSSLSGGFLGRGGGARRVGGSEASVFEGVKPNALVAALLFAAPLLFYFSVSGRWSLDGDEFYTYFDSAQSISDLLAYEIKPLYYLICHALLDADLALPLETLLRAPATLAASLIAPVFYWMLFPAAGRRAALLGAFLLIANPWIFQFSQYARFYSLMLLFSVVATLAIYRWLEDPRVRWLAIFFGAAGLATATHTTAAVLFPAASAGVVAVLVKRDPIRALGMARRFGVWACFLGSAFAIGAWLMIRDQFELWLNTEAGGYGSYSATQILAALLVHVGLPVWALAIVPLLKRGRDWTPGEVFLVTTLSLSIAPFLALASFDGGGGVAARYTLAATPCAFILAARHWAAIDKKIAAPGLRVALVGAVLAFNVPYLLSIHGDGDHFDYRETARFVDALLQEDTIVMGSARLMLGHYLEDPRAVVELGTFEGGVPRDRIERQISIAKTEQRPLILVSREDRSLLSPDDQSWLYRRFALIRTFETKRFDHRRFRMAVYEYRPARKPIGLAAAYAAPLALGATRK